MAKCSEVVKAVQQFSHCNFDSIIAAKKGFTNLEHGKDILTARDKLDLCSNQYLKLLFNGPQSEIDTQIVLAILNKTKQENREHSDATYRAGDEISRRFAVFMIEKVGIDNTLNFQQIDYDWREGWVAARRPRLRPAGDTNIYCFTSSIPYGDLSQNYLINDPNRPAPTARAEYHPHLASPEKWTQFLSNLALVGCSAAV